jgi:tetratricopeptide (TPR) repeat protein/tRNA A-37 threonylcarbamoyl transferase component Bud32
VVDGSREEPSSRDEDAENGSDRSDLVVGGRVGRYVVLGELGRGGMGRVWRAYDPKLFREVALKEVRRGTLDSTSARRLVAEARAMARLSHPNVVAVYDVETHARDQVVLVMEYVEGQTLSAWLHESRPWREVLAQFRQAGRGLAAAHTAGLLHRDFKPDNVLVGADGRVRVTDFGLAREIVTERADPPGEVDTESASATRTKASGIVGTLPYLAPERLMGAPADASTDQFAFCVSLWEALFGARPFAGESVIGLAMAMTLGPPKPPPQAQRIPAPLVAAMHRGLAPNPERRWSSMDALLSALAADPGQQRRRWWQAAAGLGAIGLGAMGLQAWAAARAARCSEEASRAHLQSAWGEARHAAVHEAITGVTAPFASRAWARIEQRFDDYAAAWTEMHVDVCEATTVRGEQSPAVMDLRMACLQRASMELSAVTQVLAEADAQTVREAHRIADGLPPLQRCADVTALQADVEPPLPDEAEAVQALRTDLALAAAARRAGRYDEARAALDAASAKLASSSYGPVAADVAVERGALLERVGEYEEAAAILREGLRLAGRWRKRDALSSAATQLVVVVGARLQRFDEGLRFAEMARGFAEGDALREAAVSASLVPVLTAKGDHDAAQHECRRAVELRGELLDADHLDVLEARQGCADVMRARGEYDAAAAEYRDLVELQATALGPSHPAVAATRHDLALVLHDQRRLEEAEAEFRGALELTLDALGEDHPIVASYRKDLAAVLQDAGKPDEAEAEQRRALAILETSLGSEHPDTASSRFELALALTAQGKLEDAEAENRRAITLLEAALGVGHPMVARAHHNLAGILDVQARYEEAEVEYKRALELLEAALQPDHPDLALARSSVARILLERAAFAEAKPFAEAAWDRRRRDDVPAVQRAHTAFLLAHVYWGAGDRALALEMADRALTAYAQAGTDEVAEVERWLAAHRR